MHNRTALVIYNINIGLDVFVLLRLDSTAKRKTRIDRVCLFAVLKEQMQ